MNIYIDNDLINVQLTKEEAMLIAALLASYDVPHFFLSTEKDSILRFQNELVGAACQLF